MGKKIQCIGKYTLAGTVLGKGNFARVELATHSVTGVKVAIKVIDMRKIKEDYLKQNVNREAVILGQLNHPNIIRLYETMKATTLYCLVMEYAQSRDILSFLKSHKEHRLSEDKARPYIRQIVSAVHYLHERGVCHRDLKMENIMLDAKKKNIRIVDFGLSNTYTMDELMKTHCGSPEYAAPELFAAGDKYGPEVDIWAMGIILYAMLVGKLPFTTVYTDQYRRIKLLKQIEKGIQLEQEHEMMHLSSEACDLLKSIIEPKPELRLPMLDIEIHPWITEGSKVPFFPFVALPRDKTLKSQVLCELCEALSLKKELVEAQIQENKNSDVSAMYNMLYHQKRIESGVYNLDHTIKANQPPEGKGKKKRSKSAQIDKDGGKKSKNKVPPPELVLPGDVPVDKNQHSTGSKEPGSTGHETKFSSFDFLALCSTPTWLGPERRRSRRRSRSPGPNTPAPHDHPRYCLAPSTDSQPKLDSPQQKINLLSPETANSAKNSVPITPNSPSLRRASSLRYSKRRNRSGSIGSKRKNFGRSSSVDVPSSKVEVVDKSVLLAMATPKSPVQRPANLLLQECYKNNVKKVKGSVCVNNGPTTSVEVHFSDTSNPCSSTDLLKPCNQSHPPPSSLAHLEPPTHQTKQGMQQQAHNTSRAEGRNLCSVRPKEFTEHSRKNKVPPKKPPRNFLSVNDAYRDDDYDDNESAMQNDYRNSDLCASPERTDLARDLEQELSDIRLLEMEECEDRVDSMAQLLSDKPCPHSGKENFKFPLQFREKCLNIKPADYIKEEEKQNQAGCSDINDIIEIGKRVSSNNPNKVDSSISSPTRPQAPKLKTPTSQTWMLLKTPLARIESFHSDDFEFYSSDHVEKGDNSPNSANTPTVPCFSYKLKLMKNKPPKLKNKMKEDIKKCQENHAGTTYQETSLCRLLPAPNDPVLSSGSESEHHDTSLDKLASGKAKIHPMDAEDQDSDSKGPKLNKAGPAGMNAITKQPNQQNSINKIKTVSIEESKSKDLCKSPAWKRGFVHFLRKKRCSRSPSNNNNNDSSTNQIAGTNGHAPNNQFSKSETNFTEDHTCSKESESRWILSPNNSIGNNVKAEAHIENQSSITFVPRSPSPNPRVFDFSVLNDSPKGKSCLLSWRTCRDCGVSEHSSEEESELGIPLDSNVNLNLKSSLERNNIQESRHITAYQFAPT